MCFASTRVSLVPIRFVVWIGFDHWVNTACSWQEKPSLVCVTGRSGREKTGQFDWWMDWLKSYRTVTHSSQRRNWPVLSSINTCNTTQCNTIQGRSSSSRDKLITVFLSLAINRRGCACVFRDLSTTVRAAIHPSICISLLVVHFSVDTRLASPSYHMACEWLLRLEWIDQSSTQDRDVPGVPDLSSIGYRTVVLSSEIEQWHDFYHDMAWLTSHDITWHVRNDLLRRNCYSPFTNIPSICMHVFESTIWFD